MELTTGTGRRIDWPTEVHQVTVAREVLAGYRATEAIFPIYHLQQVVAQAREKYADVLAELEDDIPG